jgi:hypothetical protein
MKSRFLLVVGMGMLVGWSVPQQAVAQDDDGPGTRIVSVTTFNVPFTVRGQVIPHMVARVLPATQLNPHVITSRLLFHNWGSDASQIVMVAEYASMADVDADCGQPCTDYFEANPAPEEGDEGYEAFDEARRLFLKYYSNHRDEIYVAPMGMAKVEGEMMGPVGGPDDDGDDM